MPNPLIFFIVIIAIDLILKSIQNKKKMEKARRQSSEEVNDKNLTKSDKSFSNKPLRELKRILENELESEKEKEIKRENSRKQNETIDTMEKGSTRDESIRLQKDKINKHSELENMKRKKLEIEKNRQHYMDGYNDPIKQVLVSKTEEDKMKFKEDIIKGIIFSEILGKPKSLKK